MKPGKVYHRNTPTERRCHECGGSGDITVRRKAGDPDSEVTGRCMPCDGLGWIRWAPTDPLLVLQHARRLGGRHPVYLKVRAAALGGMPIARLRMVTAAIRMGVRGDQALAAFKANAT